MSHNFELVSDGKSLEDLAGSKKERVYVLSEIGFDTEYFNEKAYQNLLAVMEEDSELTGVLIDGPITRLDRPEFLNKELTYWEKSKEKCEEAHESIKNRDQYTLMASIQHGIVRNKLRGIRGKLSDAKIVFSLHSEDVQYIASATLNDLLIRKQQEIGENLDELRMTRRHQKDSRKQFLREHEKLKGLEGIDKERNNLERKAETCTQKIHGLEDNIQTLESEQEVYREKKTRPMPQYVTRRFIEELYERYKKTCDEFGIELVTGQTVLEFGDMSIDYAHSRHNTWHPIKGRAKSLEKYVHGKLDSFEGIDVVLESGHFGIGYKQLQKMADSPAETNFRNQSRFDSDIGHEHLTIVMALPFEDQKAIGEYVKGRKSVRMSGGKPMGSRKIAATDRFANGSVTGLTIITKDEKGIVGTEWIQYQNFKDGSVLKKPQRYHIIGASSDEHLCAAEANPIVTNGWINWFVNKLIAGDKFRGRPAVMTSYINAGDVGEANSRRWQHRYQHKKRPEDILKENIKLLTEFSGGLEEIMQIAMKTTNDAMGGSVESMDVVLDAVSQYLMNFTEACLEWSDAKWVHVGVTGNHVDGVLKDLGLRETDYFKRDLRAKGIRVSQVGEPEEDSDSRVFLGGYSDARIVNVTDYGRNVNGGYLFGPVNLVVQHDPKGSGMSGVVGEGKNVGADLALAGHTHDNRLVLYKKRDNQFGVAYRLATLQGVTPTEKAYAGSVPRTQAAHEIIMPVPGDFSEKAIPAGYLRKEGLRALIEEIKK